MCTQRRHRGQQLGGENPIVLGSVSSFSDASMAAERIRSRHAPLQSNGNSLSVTCSIGISVYPDHGDDAETLIKNADVAMYASRSRGRNTFSFFSEDMTAQAIERLQLGKQHARRYVSGPREFQPGIQFANRCDFFPPGSPSKMETPGMTRSPRSKFIPIAEANGMIVPLAVSGCLGRLANMRVAGMLLETRFPSQSTFRQFSSVRYRFLRPGKKCPERDRHCIPNTLNWK